MERSRSDDKLEQILRAAASVFAEKGYHRASIRDISRATGVSLSGLYYYVESKEQLLFRIQEHCFGTVLANLERLLPGTEDGQAKLWLLIENHLRFFVNNMDEMKVLSHEADSLTGEYRRRVDRLKKRYVVLCQEILEELKPGGGPRELRLATFGLFGMLNWIYTWYRPERDIPVAELVDGIHRLFLVGYLGVGTSAPAGPGRSSVESEPSIWRR